MCGICSKFSVKCEASHKNIVIVDFLMLVAFKLGELAYTAIIKECGSNDNHLPVLTCLSQPSSRVLGMTKHHTVKTV